MAAPQTPGYLGLFFAFLWPRLLFALGFTMMGYVGSGGDPEIYQALGGYLRDLIEDPENASLAVRLEKVGLLEVGLTYTRLAAVVQQFSDGNLESILGDSGLSVVLLHGVFYLVWDNPAIVVLIQSVFNAAAYAALVKNNGFYDARRALIWNPASLYFCATHFKESFTETAILFLLVKTRGKGWFAKVPILLFLGFLRLEYLVLVALVYLVFRIGRLRNMRWPALAVMLLVLFLVAPTAYADWLVGAETAGRLYSIVYANEVTRRLLGPIVGALLPIPFVLLPLNNAWGFFYTVYGLAYYSVWLRIINTGRRRGNFRGNAYLNAGLLVLLVIGYRFTGQSGTKDRYFAPFFPLLIIGLTLLRREPEDPVSKTVRHASENTAVNR
jgi:hypothetical protein